MDRTTETAVIAVVATGDKFATLSSGAQKVYLVSDADCFIEFDQPAMASRSFLIKANQHPAEFEFSGGNVNKVHAITATGTANLYILAVRT